MNFKKLALYIHIPFCNAKCPYCSFFSIVAENELIKRRYLDALKKEIEICSQKYPETVIQSIYLGGGTPTTLSGRLIAELIEICYKFFKIDKDIEITIESNPATFDSKKAGIIFQAGVNRLSIGAQSFSDKVLKNIGRIHDKKDVINSYHIARSTGFKNINIDLMFGLPGQTIRQFNKTLEEIVQLHPEHISLYGLSIEPGTPFEKLLEKGILRMPSDDITYAMYQKAIVYFKNYGYEQYEISNFALPGKYCYHNQIYWKNQSYLGIGASSTSYVKNIRFKNYSDLIQYIYLLENNILPIESKEILPLKEEMAETVILHLRMMEGLAKSDFKARFKIPIESIFAEQLKRLKDQGLLADNESHYLLTRKGISLSNIAFIEFLD
ncbi:MAG: radical SAM family heme chaperone HemW [Atribacterota bacterium]